MISLDTTLKKNTEKYIESELGAETVIMNLETGDYISINSVGTSILKAMDDANTPKEIIQILMGQYEVSEEECTTDVMEYLNKLAADSVILTS